VTLVGKGVCFDTGGLDLKPSGSMLIMKKDMGGAANVLALALMVMDAGLKLRLRVLIPAVENAVAGNAFRPLDIFPSRKGLSVEIGNTDAEGRLVLADGLCYARQLGCTHLIDAATLTGAVVVALGYVNAGVFANDEKMYERFNRATNEAGEKFWRLPLDDEYKDNIRSNIADIVNSGGRWGGAVNAAMFLKEFAEDTPWLHLDIAGTAWTEENKPWIAKGPSGIAVRSLVEFAREFNN
jgi:leucyl aminopeptidase